MNAYGIICVYIYTYASMYGMLYIYKCYTHIHIYVACKYIYIHMYIEETFGMFISVSGF